MSLFFDRFKLLCEEKGESPNSFARKNGIPSGSITAWKNGSIPRPATLDKIATALGVSVGYLLGTEDEKKPTSEGERPVSDDDIKFALFGGDGEITDAMYDEVKRFAQMVKLREEAEKHKKE